MSFVPGKKKTVLVPSGPGDYLHLYVILTDACKNNMHLLVPISSIKEGKFHDNTCEILAANQEHPFIKKDSFVYFSKIQSRPRTHIIKCVEERSYIEREEVSDSLFQRISEGVTQSKFVPAWAKKQFIYWPH